MTCKYFMVIYRLAKGGGGPIFLKEDHFIWEGVDSPREYKDSKKVGDHTSTQYSLSNQSP